MKFDKAICLLAVLLAGCAIEPVAPEPDPAPPPVAPAPVPPPLEKSEAEREAEEVLSLLAYYQRLLAMTPDELKREYQNVSQAPARERSELARLRLAMLMLVPGAAWSDDARLLTLLEGIGGRSAPFESPRRQLALLLQRLAGERAAAVKRLETQAKEEQRRADELQQKLDAMLKIEENLRRGRK